MAVFFSRKPPAPRPRFMRTLERTRRFTAGASPSAGCPHSSALRLCITGEPPPRLALPLPRPRALIGRVEAQKRRPPTKRKSHDYESRPRNWADKAIRTFRKQTGCDHEDSLCDLIADLRHWPTPRILTSMPRCTGQAITMKRNCQRRHGGPQFRPRHEPGLRTGAGVGGTQYRPRFKVPSLETDSYRIAALCNALIAKTKRDGA